MKTLLWLKKIFTQSCVFYSFLITAVYLLGSFVDSSWLPKPSMIGALLLFSVVLAIENSFLFSNKLVFSLRLLIHYIVTTIVFYIVFVVWGGYKNNGGSVLTVLLVFTFAYVLCAIIVAVYRYLTAELRKDNSEYKQLFNGNSYESQFGGNKK